MFIGFVSFVVVDSGKAEDMKPLPKMWTNQETKLLFFKRINNDKQFNSSKRHQTLWSSISSELLNEQGLNATPKQCENKFKSLKREYKATLDHNNRSGSNVKTFPFYEEFNNLYGYKASWKPGFTLSSTSIPTKDHVIPLSSQVNPPSRSNPNDNPPLSKKKKQVLPFLTGLKIMLSSRRNSSRSS